MPSSPNYSLLAVAAVIFLAVGCGTPAEPLEAEASSGGSIPTPSLEPTVQRIGPDSLPVLFETLATGLDVPWDLAFAPDGRIFLTERVGRIRVLEKGRLRPEPWASLEVFAEDEAIRPESGLMGIALSPDFARTGRVYVMATVRKAGGSAAARLVDRVFRRIAGFLSIPVSSPYESRVYRLTDRGGRGIDPVVVIDDLPANYYHAGGALRFGPDGMLYLTVGDNLDSPRAQDPSSRIGALLRYRPDGGIPDDNPLPGSPVYAHGLRNTQALAWHLDTGELFGTDHGPSFLPHEGGRSGHDELNVLEPGANYGWPAVAGVSPDGRFRSPVAVWDPGIAPAGLAVYGDGPFPWRGDLLVTGLRGQQLRRLVVERAGVPAGWGVVREDTLIAAELGRLRSVRVGPDGHLYLTTSNRDGRGSPADVDDRLLRIRPAPAPAPSPA